MVIAHIHCAKSWATHKYESNVDSLVGISDPQRVDRAKDS